MAYGHGMTGRPHALAIILASAALVVGCGTSRNASSEGTPETPPGKAADAALVSEFFGDTGRTDVEILAPVTAAGEPAPGWMVTPRSDTSVDCGGSSLHALTEGVYQCSPAYVAAIACWKGADGSALCLNKLTGQNLTRMRATFDAAAEVSRPPIPLSLDLADGAHCGIISGGARKGRPSHPDIPVYECDSGDLVWGDSYADAVSHGTDGWTVRAAGYDGPIRTVDVTKATFVAHAAG